MGKLFGTDGIRGIANEHPMTPEMALNIGRATALTLKKENQRPKIIIGKDTRISGDMLEHALVSGICSVGGDAYLAGILPTPGIAYLTVSSGSDAGVVISASHNPFYDNGIKIFNNNGFKLSDEKEIEIERILLNENMASISKNIRMTGMACNINDPEKRYLDFLEQTVSSQYPLQGLKIILDCANGAGYKVAPKIFERLGADIEILFNRPDGKNINEKCGSQDPKALQKKIVEKKADIGLAFDGDADRLTAVDEKGKIINGDIIIAVLARKMKQTGILENNIAVSTVMSNIGLGLALQEMGVKHAIAQVGDRCVMQKMISKDAVLGGEESGHIILLNHHTTGDGILAAIKLAQAVKEESEPLSEISKIVTIFPQELINVEVQNKPDIKTMPGINETIRSVEKNLAEKGRVLVRYSGTQHLCRVMVEGPTIEKTRRYCRMIADKIQTEIGL